LLDHLKRIEEEGCPNEYSNGHQSKIEDVAGLELWYENIKEMMKPRRLLLQLLNVHMGFNARF
jgi:hypothetical protein